MTKTITETPVLPSRWQACPQVNAILTDEFDDKCWEKNKCLKSKRFNIFKFKQSAYKYDTYKYLGK